MVDDPFGVIRDNITQIKNTNDYPNLGVAFQHWVADKILRIDDETKIADEVRNNQTRDGGIDYFYIDNENNVITIVQTKYSASFDKSASLEDLIRLLNIHFKLLDGSGFSERFAERQQQYKTAVRQGFQTNLFFVIAGKLTNDVKNEIQVYKSRLPTNVSFTYYEASDILHLIGSPKSGWCKIKISKNEAFESQSSTPIKTVVANVPASELARIHKKIHPFVLFSENPRLPLGRTAVSKSIEETLCETPQNLWYFNNGISAFCDGFNYDEASGELYINNLKIVNGCQTVATIAKTMKTMDNSTNNPATVLFRLFQVSDREFRTEISKNTNTQNKLNSSDLMSNNADLKLLVERFKKHRPEFFLERKKKMFNSLDPHKQKALSPKTLHVIENFAAAKYRLAFGLGLPSKPIDWGQKIFEGVLDCGEPVFDKLYTNAHPDDFIFPHLLIYGLKKVKNDSDTVNGRGATLLRTTHIGQYYLLATIGQVLKHMVSSDSKRIICTIIEAAARNDSKMINESLVYALKNTSEKIVFDINSVMSGKNELCDYSPTELLHTLREDDKFSMFWNVRKTNLNSYSDGSEPIAKIFLDLVA